MNNDKNSSPDNSNNRNSNFDTIVLICIAAAVAGFAVSSRIQQNKLEEQYSVTKTRKAPDDVKRPEFELPDLDGKLRNISEWDGNVILLNFWATWCPPCRDEIPVLIDLQKKYSAQGFQVIGVAIDQAELVESYSDSMGVNYPIMVGEDKGTDISANYGNRLGMLPYTVIIGRNSMIMFIKKGEVTKDEIEELIQPLLKEEASTASRHH